MSSSDSRTAAGLHKTIPALPVRAIGAAVAHYRDRFGFEAPHETDGFAVLVRDDAVLHLWAAATRNGVHATTCRNGPSAPGLSRSWPAPRAAGSR